MLLAQKTVQANVQPKINYGIFDLKRMEMAVNSKRKELPSGLSREEKRRLLSGK